MTVISCGRTNLSERSEAITRVLREQQGFRTDGGCGQTFDLDDHLQHMRVSRCLECWRWLCAPCIVAHFNESSHAYRPGQARSESAIAPDPTTADGGADAQTRVDMAQGRGAPDAPQTGSRPSPSTATT